MATQFLNQLPKGFLNDLKTLPLYRHGIYRDNVLFSSLYVPNVGKEYFAKEWLNSGLSTLIRLDDQAYVDEREFKLLSDLMFEKITSDQNYLADYIKTYQRDNELVLELSRKINKKSWSAASNEELGSAFEVFYQQSTHLAHWLWSMEFLNDAVDRYSRQILRGWNPKWTDQQIGDFLAAVSYISKKFSFQQELVEAMALSSTNFANEMSELHKKYSWLNINTWDGRPWSFTEYQDRVKKMLQDKERISKELVDLNNQVTSAQQLIDKTTDLKVRQLLKTIQELIYLKTYRIDVFSQSWYYVLGLIDEIAERLDYTYTDLLRLTPEEIISSLIDGPVLLSDIAKRDHYAVVRLHDKVFYLYGAAQNVLSSYLDSVGTEPVTELKGTIAYKGSAKGVAKVLMTDRDLHKLRKGDVLVANLTNPNFNPAFEKVVAVVTDEGGILCHSAIMAREFSLPCIIGTKIATKVLHDGDYIEVDAHSGVVRILQKAEG